MYSAGLGVHRAAKANTVGVEEQGLVVAPTGLSGVLVLRWWGCVRDIGVAVVGLVACTGCARCGVCVDDLLRGGRARWHEDGWLIEWWRLGWSNGDARSHHCCREVAVCWDRVFVARPGIFVVGLIVRVLDNVTPNCQNFDGKSRSSGARVSPVFCAVAQETLALVAGLGDLGNVFTNLGR